LEPSESLYNELLSGNPSQGTLFKILSMMKKEGMLERVIDECTKALETYPDDIKIRRLLAEACFEAGRMSRAESEIRSVIDGINELMTSYRFQANLFISQGRNTEAIEALKLYIIHCPDDKESYALLESMLPREEVAAETLQVREETATVPGKEDAGSIEQPLEAETPDIATATLAEMYFEQGLTEEAIEIYSKVIEKNPYDSSAMERLGELKSMLEQARLAQEKEEDRLRRRKKMVSILESWLEGIRERSKPGLSIG
jgi:tetratricopeptide (TPR) repeat protein